MALNLDIIGKTTEPITFTYTKDTMILYALGIGAGPNELDFIYEKKIKVFPTFAVIPFMPSFINSFMPVANINPFALLHGEHKIILHKSIPSSGTVFTSITCDSIYDKGDKGAILNVTFETRNKQGDLIFENKAVAIDKSAGNFDGDRGPKPEVHVPPEGKKPDFCTEYTISQNQAALYRLSGDKNPLHVDPEFSKKVGFDQPILHGLCSFGFTGRAVLHNLCNSDPARLKSFAVRFMNVVYPGDRLKTMGWKTASKTYIIQTINQDDKLILGNAVVEIV